MSILARTPLPPRFGSAAEVSALTGLSVKTIRRRIKDGSLHGVKLGRRVLIPFDAIDCPRTRETPIMATVHKPASEPTAAKAPYVPRIDPAELARRNQLAIELLNSWETDGDEQEQRETLAVLCDALGEHR